jgi:hypothetical protein
VSDSAEFRLTVVVDGLFQFGPWWVERVHVPFGPGHGFEIQWVARLDLEGPYMAKFDHLYDAQRWVGESFKTPEGRDG